MKLYLILTLFVFAAVATKVENQNHNVMTVDAAHGRVEQISNHNILVNILIRQLIAYIRTVIKNGSNLFRIPPLDPLELDHYHLVIPAGLINLEMNLTNALMTGMGAFVVHRSNLRLPDLTFELDVSVPRLDISGELYDLSGDFFAAVPIYGKGKANFTVEGFRFRAKLYLKQSDDEKSIIIDKIEDTSFEIPTFRSKIDGAMGGGDIDTIVNAITEQVLIGYVNRFQGAISQLAARVCIKIGNPILEQLDTWRYISPFL